MDTKIALIALSALITAGCQTEETTEKKQSVEVVENSVTESTEAYIPSDRAEQKAYALAQRSRYECRWSLSNPLKSVSRSIRTTSYRA